MKHLTLIWLTLLIVICACDQRNSGNDTAEVDSVKGGDTDSLTLPDSDYSKRGGDPEHPSVVLRDTSQDTIMDTDIRVTFIGISQIADSTPGPPTILIVQPSNGASVPAPVHLDFGLQNAAFRDGIDQIHIMIDAAIGDLSQRKGLYEIIGLLPGPHTLELSLLPGPAPPYPGPLPVPTSVSFTIP